MMQPMNGMNGQMMNSQMMNGQMNGMMGNMNGQMMNGMNGGMNGMMGNMNGGQWVQTPQGPMMVMWTGNTDGSCILQTPDGTCCVGMMMPVNQQGQMMNGDVVMREDS